MTQIHTQIGGQNKGAGKEETANGRELTLKKVKPNFIQIFS